MPTARYRTALPVSAEEAFAWHARPGALERLLPPWDGTRVLARSGSIAGGSVTLEVPFGPLPLRWVARHTDYQPPAYFRDEQVEGPFARWVHTHRFHPLGPDACELEDEVDYDLPLGPLGAIADEAVVKRMLDRMFRFRHARTVSDLRRHAAYRFEKPLRVAVTGASGLIGAALTAFLTTGGHTVVPLVRRAPAAGEAAIHWDPARGVLDAADLEGFDAVVHLAGENIAGGRWTPERKARILDSRVDGTTLLATALAKLQSPPRVLVSASGVGVYGNRGDELLTEASTGGEGFLADVVRAWEAPTERAAEAGVRVVNLRIAPAVTPAGGPLAKLLPPFKLGLGGPVGSGRQYFSWIDADDLLGAILHAIATEGLSGPVNACAPNPVPNAEFAHALGHVLHRPAVLPLPAFAVLAAFGQMGQEALLDGQRAVPEKLLASGFAFDRPTITEAIAFELGEAAPA